MFQFIHRSGSTLSLVALPDGEALWCDALGRLAPFAVHVDGYFRDLDGWTLSCQEREATPAATAPADVLRTVTTRWTEHAPTPETAARIAGVQWADRVAAEHGTQDGWAGLDLDAVPDGADVDAARLRWDTLCADAALGKLDGAIDTLRTRSTSTAEAVASVVAHLGETGSCRVAPNGDVYGRAEENSREMRLGAVDPGDVERLREELKEAFSMHTAR